MTPLVGIGNILILDRTPDALAVAQLQAYGGCVLTASDAASAESLIRRQPPDLILLDTAFAEAEDADFVQSLFAEPDLASVILLTPQADAEHVFQALAAGYVDCVSRPLHSVDTLARIVSHLRRGKKQRQLALDNSRLAQRLAAETAALSAQQRSFQTLAEGLPDNIARYDLSSRLVYLNPQLLRTLGVAAQDLLGKTPQEAFPGSEFAAYQACIEAALATGQDGALELALPDSDGKFHHLIRFVVERGAAGEVVGVLAIGRDVSERKNAERQLEILDRAVEASSEATFLMDGQGRFVYVNGAACRSLGYSRDELLTMSPLDIDPDITPEAFAALLQAMFTGNHPGGPVESRHQARDGRTFPVEMYGSVIEYDQAQFCLVMARDISERKAAEAQLHRSEQMFRAMVENSPDAIARYDSQCRRIFVNRATQLMYGQSAEQLLGRTPSECSALVNAEGFTQAIREVFARGVEGLREVVFTNADGQTCWGHARMVPECDAAGNVVSVLSIARDITALKSSEVSFRTLAENAPDNIVRYDRHCRVRYQNPRLEATWGALASSFVGKTPLEAFPDGEFADYQGRIAAVIATGQESEIEICLPDCGSGVRYHQVRFVAERDADGQIVGALAMGRDITEHRQLLQQLEIHNAALNTSNDAVFILDEALRFVFVNETACQSVGYSRSELLRMGPADIDADMTPEMVQSLMASTKASGAMVKFESRHRAKDGRIHPVEISISIFSYSGQTFALAIARDISERKRLDEALRFVAQRGWDNGELNFFEALSEYLGQVLEVDYVVIDKLAEESGYVDTLALYARGAVRPNLSYALAGTPCDNVMDRGVCVYPSGIQQLFPEDRMLVEMGAESYAGTPLWDSAGQPLGLIAILDSKPLSNEGSVVQLLKLVAPRAAAELERLSSDARLRAREREFRSLAESSPDCIIRYDLSSRILYLNSELARQLGVADSAEVIGKRPREMWPDGRYDAIDATIAQALATKSIAKNELRVPRADGESVFEIRVVPEWSDGGEIIGTIAFGRDITELRHYQETLQARELEFRSLAENAPDNIARYDAQGRIRYVNPVLEKTMGLSASEMLGRFPSDFIPDWDNVTFLSVAETGQSQDMLLEWPDADGGILYHHLRVVAERNAQGTITGILAIGRDLTAQKRAERELLILGSAINNATDSIFLIDSSGRFAYVNDAATHMLGYRRDQLLQLGPADIDTTVTGETLACLQSGMRGLGPRLGRMESSHRAADGRVFPVEMTASLVEHQGERMALVVVRDISERKAAERQRLAHLRFLECMNQIDRAMQSASDVDGVLGNVLDVVLDVFACDRAFLGYPCDPQASTWQVAVERSRPAYPCVVSHRGAMPMDGEMAARLQLLLQASAPLQFGPGTEHPLPAEILDEFGFQSLMSVAVYPRGDKPWEFGIEQCAQSRVWSPDDEALLHEIGRRLADGLTSLLAHRRVVESEAHLRALVRTIPDLIWLKDPDGIFLRCNQQFERFVGLEEARIVGRNDLDIREREAALFYRENDKRILASGQSAVTEEWLTFASDGYRGLFEVIRTPLYDPAGNTLGILGVAHDITRRKRMEDALRASEREFRSLAENLPDVVMRYDLDCRRIYVNPAYLREIDGRLDQVINAELDAQQWHSTNVSLDEYKQSLQQAMRSGKSSELLVHWQSHLTGEALCYSLHIVPERDHHGQVSGVLCIGRNIASLLETERRLEASRLQLRGLAARREDAREEERRHIARELHDGLGQQLTALRFSVTMLDYQFGEEQPSIREVVGKLLQQVNRTIQTTREVSSAMRPPVLDMGIVPALEWLVAEYALLGSVSFELKGESGPVHMKEANTVVVFRIVQESLTNAVRHSKADRIQVIFGQEADVYVVEVRDNGIGFDPDGPHDPHSVGLVGIRERIHAVGGELVVSSAPGWGTVVRVRIPATENQGEES